MSESVPPKCDDTLGAAPALRLRALRRSNRPPRRANLRHHVVTRTARVSKHSDTVSSPADASVREMHVSIAKRSELSTRDYHRMLCLSPTIADLERTLIIIARQIAEAPRDRRGIRRDMTLQAPASTTK